MHDAVSILDTGFFQTRFGEKQQAVELLGPGQPFIKAAAGPPEDGDDIFDQNFGLGGADKHTARPPSNK